VEAILIKVDFHNFKATQEVPEVPMVLAGLRGRADNLEAIRYMGDNGATEVIQWLPDTDGTKVISKANMVSIPANMVSTLANMVSKVINMVSMGLAASTDLKNT
jgi:hypothetical protein